MDNAVSLLSTTVSSSRAVQPLAASVLPAFLEYLLLCRDLCLGWISVLFLSVKKF